MITASKPHPPVHPQRWARPMQRLSPLVRSVNATIHQRPHTPPIPFAIAHPRPCHHHHHDTIYDHAVRNRPCVCPTCSLLHPLVSPLVVEPHLCHRLSSLRRQRGSIVSSTYPTRTIHQRPVQHPTIASIPHSASSRRTPFRAEHRDPQRTVAFIFGNSPRRIRSIIRPSLSCSSRTATDPTSGATASTGNSDFPSGGVAHVRLNRAIEIVIDSIQSLEGAVNNFDQFVFGLIYGRLSTRTEIESIEVSLSIHSFPLIVVSVGYDWSISYIESELSITIDSNGNRCPTEDHFHSQI